MSRGRAFRPQCYAAALAGVTLAIHCRVWLAPIVGPLIPLLTFFLVLTLTACFCGLGPSILYLVVSSLALLYFVFPPIGSFLIEEPIDLIGLLLYLAAGLVMISVIEVERRVRLRLEQEIAERRKFEARTRESERLYRAIGESIDYGLWTCDAAGQIIHTSDSFLKLTGVTLDECSQRSWGALVHPEDAERTIAAWNECVRTARPWDVEHRIRGVDGRYHPVIARGVPVRDEQGRVTGWAGIHLDISRLKEAEAALREQDRRKDEFLAMLAHELRNPLAPISHALEIMALAEDDQEAQHWSREVIHRQLGHLTSLVNDLLDVSRITQGKITLTKSVLTVSSFIHAAVESSRQLIENRGHRLKISLPETPLRVEGDLTRLSQVVLNLLNNAAKYTPEGGHILLTVSSDAGMCRISVQDDGEGISAEMLPRVFDLFTQASRSLDRSQGGLGVGLTVVKRLVEMHGGTIHVQSAGPEKGSEFVVSLPLCPEPMPRTPETGSDRIALGRNRPSRHILVVDDHQDTRESIARMLRRLGHRVDVADDGLHALEAVTHFAPELVLLDIGLPGMDGYEVARRMRTMRALDGLFIVALTGYGSEEDRRKSQEAGCDEHLIKPVQLEALSALMERIEAPHAPDRPRTEQAMEDLR